MSIDFTLAVEQWVSKAKERADMAFRATTQDALALVKSLTPVQTGYLRANWTVVRNDDPQPIAGRPVDSDLIINQLRLGDRLVILNPVVYAARVEYGFVGTDSLGRTYNQIGRGMMQQTIAETPRLAREATDRVMEMVP